MAKVTDRWHLSRPPDGAALCEHGKAPAAGHGKGLQWQARWRDDSGQQRKENFRRQADAKAKAASAETDVRRGDYIDAKAGRATFKDTGEAWRKSRPHRPSTAKAVEQHLRCYAYPVFGGKRIAGIRPSEIQAWVTGLATTQGLAPSTARTVFNTVKAVFRAAVHDRVIARSPCDGVKATAVPRKQIVPLTVDQVSALADALPEQYRALVITGAGTGLRPGELFGLQVQHVNFLKRTVRVEQQVQQTAKSGVYVCPPKTQRSYRTVPLPQVVAD
ncbi:tyrosine-type recombinase/integrase, partial [Streptomyces sp. NPDC059631]|uniref:tyrosine-type recombinase/integrase n=1 Tax=Streptomyces sp. NPDC059631 TaxID=3346890 RepID=UPI0036985A61